VGLHTTSLTDAAYKIVAMQRASKLPAKPKLAGTLGALRRQKMQCSCVVQKVRLIVRFSSSLYCTQVHGYEQPGGKKGLLWINTGAFVKNVLELTIEQEH
jgi:hypothetical protein